MKLITITFGNTPRLPGLRPAETGHIECDKPSDALRGWKLVIRGQQIYFVSPPGWVRDQNQKRRDGKGPVTVHGPVPMNDVYLQWQAEDAVELEAVLKTGKPWESPAFGWQPAPVAADKPILEQIPVGQMGDA